MINNIKPEMSVNYTDAAYAHSFIEQTEHFAYDHEIDEDKAFIITTYFTSAWLHAFEHIADLKPGIFPPRSYAGEKIKLSLGRYEISLKFNSCEIDKDKNWYTDQWVAEVFDNITSDNLELVIEGEYDYSPGYATSELCEIGASELVKTIITQCENEFGFKLINARQLRSDIGDEFGDLYDDNNMPMYPEWFTKNLWPIHFCE